MVAALLLGALGVALLALGLLFLLGSAGQGSRLAVAGTCLLLGAGLLGIGVRSGKGALGRTPGRIRADLLRAARERSGELSDQDLDALFAGRRAEAEAVLRALVASGDVRREESGPRTWYVFRALLPRLTLRRCERCDAEYDWDYEPATCASCGGAVRTRVEGHSTRGEELVGLDPG